MQWWVWYRYVYSILYIYSVVSVVKSSRPIILSIFYVLFIRSFTTLSVLLLDDYYKPLYNLRKCVVVWVK